MSFTKNSEKIIQFVSSNYLLRNNSSISSSINNIFALFFNIIHFCNKRKKQFSLPRFTKINHFQEIPKPKELSFDGDLKLIERYIDLNIKWKSETEYKIGSRNFRFFCLTETKPSQSFLFFWLSAVYLWFEIISHYAPAHCTNELNVYFYMTDLEKKLPESTHEIINMNHVNTAFTYSCRPKNEIVVFRKEEWLKVLMHESFHSFGLDFSEMDNTDCHGRIRTEMFPNVELDSKINLFEAYTEFWAEIWNIAFCVFFLNPTIRKKAFIIESAIFLQMEQKYSCFQLVKTLHFMNLTYDTLCDKGGKKTAIFKEDTNVLSYFIIKCILIVNAPFFFVWSIKNNGIETPFVFSKSKKNQHVFCSFLIENYRNPIFLKNIQESADVFNKLIINKNKKIFFLKKNMRMTIFELD